MFGTLSLVRADRIKVENAVERFNLTSNSILGERLGDKTSQHTKFGRARLRIYHSA